MGSRLGYAITGPAAGKAVMDAAATVPVIRADNHELTRPPIILCFVQSHPRLLANY